MSLERIEITPFVIIGVSVATVVGDGSLRQVRQACDLAAIERQRPHPHQRLIGKRCEARDLGKENDCAAR